MRLGEKITVFILRPIYRTFFERLLWWFLARVKIFFLSDIGAQLANIENHLRQQDQGLQSERQTAMIEERFRALEASNRAQWDAIERLLLAIFRQPDPRASNHDLSRPFEQEIQNGADLNAVHAADNIH